MCPKYIEKAGTQFSLKSRNSRTKHRVIGRDLPQQGHEENRTKTKLKSERHGGPGIRNWGLVRLVKSGSGQAAVWPLYPWYSFQTLYARQAPAVSPLGTCGPAPGVNQEEQRTRHNSLAYHLYTVARNLNPFILKQSLRIKMKAP